MLSKEEYVGRLKKWKYEVLPYSCINCRDLRMHDSDGKIMFNPYKMQGNAICYVVGCNKWINKY